jgi:hypothetical protein
MKAPTASSIYWRLLSAARVSRLLNNSAMCKMWLEFPVC